MDIEGIISKLSISEKSSLISGQDFWHTKAIHQYGIPSLRMTDGPNGVRGTRYFNGVPAACFPCGTALASTWDKNLIEQGGTLMGQEAIAKGASILLGPTVNIQRSPLGGRGFESFSEDPVLSGFIAAATVRGIQSTGVVAVIKHFICNDQEHDRHAVDSIVSQRALRELYLLPFQIAQRDSQPYGYMTSYNKVNGAHASESKWLLDGIVRQEWGFKGIFISDWWGTYSTSAAINAGLDIEMPGPAVWRARLVNLSVAARTITMQTLNSRVRNVLNLVERVGPLAIPENAEENTINTQETAGLLRRLGAEGIVLCKNNNNILPFNKSKTTAVIGPNAKFSAFCGGGSAKLRPYYAVTPFDGLSAQSKNIKYALGCTAYKKTPLLSSISRTPSNKQTGVEVRVYTEPAENKNRIPVETMILDSSDCFLDGWSHPGIKSSLYWIELEGIVTAEVDGEYQFSLSVNGTAKLYVDGKEVVDNTENQRPGDGFFGAGTAEEVGTIPVKKGQEYRVLVKFGTAPTSKRNAGSSQQGPGGLRVGCTRVTDAKELLHEAVKLAKSVDQVILCIGLSYEWESEGYDRAHMDLPPGTDELVSAVCKANQNVIIVNQSGTPVSMPWIDEAPAILQAWFGGNETGNTIADVVFGDVNPSGKMPLTWPKRAEDNPAFLNYRSEHGKVQYGEGIYVGYKFYEKVGREVLFPFGHGLSYTLFEITNLKLTDDGKDSLSVSVTVRNTGPRSGAEVVQVYATQQVASVQRPLQELRAFEKVFLKVKESREIKILLSKKYATSYWDEEVESFVMEEGVYDLAVRNSSAGQKLTTSFKVSESVWWKGL